VSDADAPRLRRDVFSVASLHDEDDARAFWHAKTSEERLRATELMRQVLYGYSPSTARLRRVLEIARRERG
jgi:hypothetical protein